MGSTVPQPSCHPCAEDPGHGFGQAEEPAQGLSRAPWLGQSQGVPDGSREHPVSVPRAPHASPLGISSLGSKPKPSIFPILSPRNARLV